VVRRIKTPEMRAVTECSCGVYLEYTIEDLDTDTARYFDDVYISYESVPYIICPIGNHRIPVLDMPETMWKAAGMQKPDREDWYFEYFLSDTNPD
jgi:hypothetical protein